jgi:hypothetical protein
MTRLLPIGWSLSPVAAEREASSTFEGAGRSQPWESMSAAAAAGGGWRILSVERAHQPSCREGASAFAQGRQQDLAHDGHRNLPGVLVIVVAGQNRDHEVEVGNDDEPLAAVAEAGDPPPTVDAPPAEPPLIALLEPIHGRNAVLE